MLRALVTGAGGFLGGHLCRHLKDKGFWVRGADIVEPRYGPVGADEYLVRDLRLEWAAWEVMKDIDVAYCLAANMGGMGFIGKAEEQAAILYDNAAINLFCAKAAGEQGVKRVFYSSSACVYPEHLQLTEDAPMLREEDAYPATPDTEYGWEKLFSERVYLNHGQAYGYTVRIARFHNVYGPQGSWDDGREKAPAALCRKVAQAKLYGGRKIEIWGDGKQTRSFCYVDDCIQMICRLMDSDFGQPLNIGTDRLVTINELADSIAAIAGLEIEKKHDLSKPVGVRGRNADLSLMRQVLGFEPQVSLERGLRVTYSWIEKQVRAGLSG